MTKIKVHSIVKLFFAITFSWLYIPHLLIFILMGGVRKELIISDLIRLQPQVGLNLPIVLLLLFELHHNKYYRKVFYHRVGLIMSLLIGWWRPGDKTLIIATDAKIGQGLLVTHAYASVLNAEKVGDNFSLLQCTTIGVSKGKRPVIGNNVSVGANVVIVGGIKIGDNVTVGAGSVVVKDVPDNAVVVGNPAHVVRYKE